MLPPAVDLEVSWHLRELVLMSWDWCRCSWLFLLCSFCWLLWNLLWIFFRIFLRIFVWIFFGIFLWIFVWIFFFLFLLKVVLTIEGFFQYGDPFFSSLQGLIGALQLGGDCFQRLLLSGCELGEVHYCGIVFSFCRRVACWSIHGCSSGMVTDDSISQLSRVEVADSEDGQA